MRRGRSVGAARLGALAAAGALTARLELAGVVAATARGGAARWQRTNYAGRPVTLLGGPVLAAASTTTAVLGAPSGWRAAAAVAGAVSGLVGGYDDIVGSRPDQARYKGFAGHLRALRAGHVSSGAVKVAGIGATAAAAAALTSRRGGLVDVLLTTGLIAGTANLVNLLDLRPGRAAKAAVLAGAVMLGGDGGSLVAGPTGAAAALLTADLGERIMLGDCGANSAGALVGLRLAAMGGRAARIGLLAGVVGLNLASEKVSFTTVIESTPVLRDLDRLGRRPPS